MPDMAAIFHQLFGIWLDPCYVCGKDVDEDTRYVMNMTAPLHHEEPHSPPCVLCHDCAHLLIKFLWQVKSALGQMEEADSSQLGVIATQWSDN